jgi:NADH dehydrogenase
VSNAKKSVSHAIENASTSAAIGSRARVSGFAGWMLWLFVHLVGLTGFKNRLSVLSSWTISFLSNSRLQRAITTQQVVARLASDEQSQS